VGRLLIFAITLLAFALPASAGATSPSDDWPRLGASRLVTADGALAAGEPVWLFLDKADEHRHSVSHSLWATTSAERGGFVLRAPYRGPIKHAAERNGGWANFEIAAGNDASELWFWEFPAHWNGSGWEVERGALPRRIPPVL